MPRMLEVCPTVLCPHPHASKTSHSSNTATRVLRILLLMPRHVYSAFARVSSGDCRQPTADCRLLSTACLLFLLITYHSSLITLQAQSATATLSGTVVDQNGAVVPDVKIAVISIAQGFQRSATTKEEGTFVVPLLPPGNYTVKAEHQGFTPAEVRDVVLNVNGEVSIRIHLKVGNVTSQTVEIVEGTSLIDESPAVATVVDRHFVANLPLNGRSFQSLITLSPGVVLTKVSAQEQGQFSVNGQRPNANYFMVDGVGANIGVGTGTSTLVLGQTGAGSVPGFGATGGTNNLVSVDALQEFKIQTSTYAAEFGRTSGAQVSIVTRSGTNDFHGNLFEYFRNEALDANDWFNNSRRLPKPATRQNDFGGVVGGPIVLPRFGEGGDQPGYHGRNRSFFFFSYEGLRLQQPLTGIKDVPALRVRETAPLGLRPFLNAFPVPTSPERVVNGVPLGLAEFAGSFSNPLTLNATSIRIDQIVGDKLTLFGRYNHAPSSAVLRGNAISSLSVLQPVASKTQTLTLGATILINPNISNDLRVNYSKSAGATSNRIDNFGGATVPPDSVFLPSFASSNDSNASVTIVTSSVVVGSSGNNLQRQFNILDSLTTTTGSHNLKLGFDYRRLSPVYDPVKYSQGANFSTIAQVLAGRSNFVQVQAQTGKRFPIFNNLSIYAQDTWHLSSRLTLTFGLRWEYNPPPSEASGNDPLALTSLDNPATLAFAPRGTPLYQATHNNFAPRFGMSYQLFQRQGRETVVRGGFGLFYDLGNGQAAAAFGTVPFLGAKTLLAVLFPLTPAQAEPPPINVNPPFTFTVLGIDPSLKLPYTYQWNGTLEQSLGRNQTLSTSYVGAVGRRLVRNESIRNPNPNFTLVNVARNTATSDYHALQLQFQRRLSRGLQAVASYSWSHSLDSASGDSNSAASTPSGRIDPQFDRGASDFDVRHAATGAISYDIPVRDLGAVPNALLRHWSVDTIFTARSATPINVVYNRDIGFGSFSFRPDLVAGVPQYIDDPLVGGGKRINTNAFTAPAVARQGTLERNALRGFSIHQVDLALRRQLKLTETFNLQLKAEFFNILNHPNFGEPSGSLGSFSGGQLIRLGTFGASTSMLGRSLGSGAGAAAGFNPLYQVGGPRSIQLSFKLIF